MGLWETPICCGKPTFLKNDLPMHVRVKYHSETTRKRSFSVVKRRTKQVFRKDQNNLEDAADPSNFAIVFKFKTEEREPFFWGGTFFINFKSESIGHFASKFIQPWKKHHIEEVGSDLRMCHPFWCSEEFQQKLLSISLLPLFLSFRDFRR